MTRRVTKFRLAFAVLAALSFAGTASADPFITGFGWVNTADNATDASPGGLASPTCHSGSACTGANADVTFLASGIGFSGIQFPSGASTNYTIASFLTSEGFVSGSDMSFFNGILGTHTIDPMLFELVGSAFFTNGETYTVTHDDGITLRVNGLTVLSAPGPSSPTATPWTYNGTTGNQNFDFIYGECCSGQAVFETTLTPPSAVPEPASLMLLGTGLAGLYTRRRSRERA